MNDVTDHVADGARTSCVFAMKYRVLVDLEETWWLQDLLPPKDPEVQVRALQDYGEMVASDGTIHFQRNAVFFMAQEDAEPLIRQGVLERMDMADLH